MLTDARRFKGGQQGRRRSRRGWSDRRGRVKRLATYIVGGSVIGRVGIGGRRKGLERVHGVERIGWSFVNDGGEWQVSHGVDKRDRRLKEAVKKVVKEEVKGEGVNT